MNNTAAYRNKTYTIEELLSMAEDGLIAIPNIQRPYVWSPAQLARYVDSLLHGWPCGSLLLWQTGKEGQNIFGTRTFVHRHVSPACPGCEAAVRESDEYSYLILDGQQRMQSLVLAFSAASEGYQATTHEWRRDMGSTGGNKNMIARKLLCFNLRGWSPELAANMPSFFYLDYEEEELEHTACLQWLSEEKILATDGACVPLCRLPQRSRNYPKALDWLQKRVAVILEQTQVPVLEVNKVDHKVVNMDDDEAIVQIFTRLNTAGTPLTKEQIQAAKVKSLWPDFPEKIETLKDILSKEPYQILIEDDDLVNGFNIVLRSWYKTPDISTAYAQTGIDKMWEELWNRFSHYTCETVFELNNKKLFFRTEYKSLYVLWFPVAHMCCSNVAVKDSRILVRWLLVTTWAKIWANRSGQYVKSFTNSLINRDDSADTDAWLKRILLGEERDSSLITAAKNTIDNLAASHRGSVRDYYMPLWAWTRLSEQRINFVLSFGYNAYAVDHIMPVARITDPNLKAKFNSLGNCWLLCTVSNTAKSDDAFKTFLKNFGVKESIADVAHILRARTAHLQADTPDKVDLTDIEQRENAIKQEIIEYIEEDIEMFFPNEDNIQQHQYSPDTSGIYRGDDYLNAINGLGAGTKGSYISHIRTAMRNLKLTEEDVKTDIAPNHEKLEEYRSRIKEQGNAATGWGKYLNFLMGGKITGRNIRVNARVRQAVAHVDPDGAVALVRLPRVYKKTDTIVHMIIQRAIDAGCTDRNPVSVDKLLCERCKKSNINSMKSDAGNSYGRYFEGNGGVVLFVPEVWRRLIELGWAQETAEPKKEDNEIDDDFDEDII